MKSMNGGLARKGLSPEGTARKEGDARADHLKAFSEAVTKERVHVLMGLVR